MRVVIPQIDVFNELDQLFLHMSRFLGGHITYIWHWNLNYVLRGGYFLESSYSFDLPLGWQNSNSVLVAPSIHRVGRRALSPVAFDLSYLPNPQGTQDRGSAEHR